MFRATESGRGGSRWHPFAHLCREFLTGVGEGFAAAERYQRLVRMSDGELAHMGLRRSDVAWYAVFGERRPVEREVAMARPEQGDLQLAVGSMIRGRRWSLPDRAPGAGPRTAAGAPGYGRV